MTISYNISALLNWICFNTQCVVGATQILPTTLWDLFFMDKEVWKDVVWYEWKYQVSNLWNVKSMKFGRYWGEWIMKQKIAIDGYKTVSLSNVKKKQMKVHRLMAIAFLPNPENKPQVNHKNGIKTYNILENLEWCTCRENIQHAFDNWLMPNHNWKNNHPSKWKFWKDSIRGKAILQYDLQWNFIREWWWGREAQRNTWARQNIISQCCLWKAKTAWGFIWKFKTI
jgi:hypothetical protein